MQDYSGFTIVNTLHFWLLS